LAYVASENEQLAVHEFLMQLFQPMDERRTVALATQHSGGDDLLETWDSKLNDLANRTLDDARFRQAAAALLRNLEL
jgi:hypothetical protein